jgi:TM2 domain-containing membrane protein YozV
MSKDSKHKPFAPLAAFLAWLIPGAGHIYIGRPVRGAVICLAIAATFWAGIAIGGVMTVDYHYQRWWFYGQMCTGVHGVVGWYRQHAVYQVLQQDPQIGKIQVPPTGQVTPQQMRVDERLSASPHRDPDDPLAGLALATPMDNAARAYTGIAGLLNLLCIFDVIALSLMGAPPEPDLSEDGASPASGAEATS